MPMSEKCVFPCRKCAERAPAGSFTVLVGVAVRRGPRRAALPSHALSLGRVSHGRTGSALHSRSRGARPGVRLSSESVALRVDSCIRVVLTEGFKTITAGAPEVNFSALYR